LLVQGSLLLLLLLLLLLCAELDLWLLLDDRCCILCC
jgi:hypothetical protein